MLSAFFLFCFLVVPTDFTLVARRAYEPTTLSGCMLFLQSALAGLQLRRSSTPSRRALITKSGCFFSLFSVFFFFYDSLAAVKPGVVMQEGGWGSGHRRPLERM